MGVVRVEIRKFDGSAHRAYPAVLLGRDEYGTWLGIPSGTVSDSGKVYEIPGVVLVPHTGWWTAMFNAAPRNTSVYCDITTPATWHDSTVVVTDLDLDVRKIRETGEVQLVDEDEFAAHRAKFNYPDEVVHEARAAAQWLLDAVTSAREPFATHYHPWLAHVCPTAPTPTSSSR